MICPGDVLFVYGHGPIVDIIEAVTNGPSHVALFVDENTLIEAQAGGPVRLTPLDFYLKGNAHLEVWSDPSLSDEERNEMIAYGKTLEDILYDYLLIPLEFFHFEFGMKLDWYKERHHLICSTFVLDCAKHINRVWSDKPNPAPVDLRQLPLELKMVLK